MTLRRSLPRLAIIGALCLMTSTAFAQSYSYPTYSYPTYGEGSSDAGSCLSLSQNLYSGLSDASTNGAVSALQQFLAGQGYFSHATTGYFGALTAAATQAFQTAQGIQATGYVGPLTRAAVGRVSCGAASPAAAAASAAPYISSLSPSIGFAGATIVINGSGFLADNGIYFDGYPLTREGSSNGVGLSFVVPATLPSGTTAPGQHTLFVQNANGSSNQVTFTVNAYVLTAHPNIQSIAQPGTLYAGQAGTWTVALNEPAGYADALYLSPNWGDSNLTPPSYQDGGVAYGASVDLSHTYAFPGNYNVTFTLYSSAGQALASSIFVVSVH